MSQKLAVSELFKKYEGHNIFVIAASTFLTVDISINEMELFLNDEEDGTIFVQMTSQDEKSENCLEIYLSDNLTYRMIDTEDKAAVFSIELNDDAVHTFEVTVYPKENA